VPGVRIYYTLNGAEPTPADALYTGPFTVRQAATLKARAYADGYNTSGVLIANYEFDQTGPTLSDPTFRGAPLVAAATLFSSGSFGVTATDDSGVKQVEFKLDGTLLGLDTIAANGFAAPFDIAATAEGPHTLTMQAWDNLGVPSAVLTLPVVVEMAAPLPPPLDRSGRWEKTQHRLGGGARYGRGG